MVFSSVDNSVITQNTRGHLYWDVRELHVAVMVFWVPNRTQEHMVDALAVRGDEGRGVAAKSFGEACSNL